MKESYFYRGWMVTISDGCTYIRNFNEHIFKMEFPTEDEAIDWIDEYEEGN